MPGSLDEALADRPMVAHELGDPGSVLGREVSLEDLPAYAGPPEPLAGPPPEWGAMAAETPDQEVETDRPAPRPTTPMQRAPARAQERPGDALPSADPAT